MKRTPWIERKFTLDFPTGWIYNILERLHGTVPRMTAIIVDLPENFLVVRKNGKWSIKEEIGHLVDLEDLHIQRLRDFQQKLETLSAADMSNLRTNQADHNKRKVSDLINDFDLKRKVFIDLILQMDDALLNLKSQHPRLLIPMRPVDIAYFTAEHDDHHLASIRNKIQGLKPRI